MLLFTAGLVVGIIATVLVFRRNKKIQAQVEGVVDEAKQKIDDVRKS